MKHINAWHYIYLVIIFFVVLVCFILVVKYSVSEDAMDKFSFASTITSIILAVISIIYSLVAGIESANQLNRMNDIESRISSQLDKFTNIEQHLKDTIVSNTKPLQDGIAEMKDAMTKSTDEQQASYSDNK